ncbi:cytochrome b/b6 domain-containing protein [Thiococcus pfennigii]|jgi:cytochrome b|uniref:cytochrome b/b6 domain-containing protein n=1 Tax=Thiococcus pfennigii TaxID=1057 RepID=UPI0019082653|nr:cytochrome b/b6 domain-containing protein [Thiococcus pfennigii]MBK1701607.1 cytochrome B [Thiococcus pfennigii]MBK1732588.1 cytochrome B [Thiococcus pfennigii]
MQEKRILVWDLPLRLFHWLLFTLVVAAILTALQGGNLMPVHGLLGQLVLGLIAFRVAWGLFGPTYARFHNFVRGPSAVLAYLRGAWQGVGHNPLGALSVLALMAVLFVQVLLGLFANDDIAFRGPFNPLVSGETSDLITGLHRANGWLIVALVSLHVLAILYYTLVRKDNLVRPMITGRKSVADPNARDTESLRGVRLSIAFVIAVSFAAVVVWMASGGPMTVLAPPPPPVIAPW